MTPSQFEAVKVAIKQDKTGYILTLSIHPDEIPAEVMRDFVGSRYQVVMVRLNGEEKPMNRDQEHVRDLVRTAGILCRDKAFHKFLLETGQVLEASETEAINWLKSELKIVSRSELSTNIKAAKQFTLINLEFLAWKQSV
jgi:uncharacterized protein YcgL (UPF0745 family)